MSFGDYKQTTVAKPPKGRKNQPSGSFDLTPKPPTSPARPDGWAMLQKYKDDLAAKAAAGDAGRAGAATGTSGAGGETTQLLDQVHDAGANGFDVGVAGPLLVPVTFAADAVVAPPEYQLTPNGTATYAELYRSQHTLAYATEDDQMAKKKSATAVPSSGPTTLPPLAVQASAAADASLNGSGPAPWYGKVGNWVAFAVVFLVAWIWLAWYWALALAVAAVFVMAWVSSRKG